MRAKRVWVSGIVAFVIAILSGSISFGFNSEGELCNGARDNYLVLKDYSGRLGLEDEDFAAVAKAAQAISDGETERQSKFNVDQNYANISKLLQIHANDIVKAATSKEEGAIEAIAYSYRFVFLSCRACHRIYKTEMENLSP